MEIPEDKSDELEIKEAKQDDDLLKNSSSNSFGTDPDASDIGKSGRGNNDLSGPTPDGSVQANNRKKTSS